MYSRILRGQELENFKRKFNLECDSIILKIDHENKKASYYVDAVEKFELDYDLIKNIAI